MGSARLRSPLRPLRPRAWTPVIVLAATAILLASCSSSNPSPSTGPSGAPSSTTAAPSAGAPAGGSATPQPPVEADSTTKILAAEATGTIDHATSLAYQVFASLDDASLPPEYQSSNPVAPDATTALAQLSGEMDTLPAALKAKIAPFFLRPDDPASFWQSRVAPTAAGTVKLAAFAAIPMEWIDADTTPVRVWYASPLGTSERDLAVQLADEIDRSSMWEKEETAMLGHTPCTDGDLAHSGGSSRLDIYLVYPGTGLDWDGRSDQLGFNDQSKPNNGVTIEDGEGDVAAGVHCPVATHVLVNAALDFEHLKSTTAHELFHAFQLSFKQAILADRGWWMEATATWAKDLVYPEQDFEQAYLDSYWSKAPGIEGPIDSREGTAEYGAYILPFYLVQKSGDPTGTVIGQTWASSETRAPIDVLAALPGWKDSFKEFALWNWNRDSVVRYLDAGRKIPEASLSQNTICMDSSIVRHGAPNECQIKVGKKATYLDLDRARVEYVEGVPESPAVEKLTFDLTDVQSKPGLGIQALLTLGKDNEVKVEDWTDLATRSFCVQAENLTRVVLVVSNSDTAAPKVVDGSGQATSIKGQIKIDADAAGCSGWKGTMTGTYDWHLGDASGTGIATFTGIWEMAPDTALVVPCRSAPPSPGNCLAYIPNGTIAWSWDVHEQGCQEHASGTVAAGVVREANLYTERLILTDDGDGHYGYWGGGGYVLPTKLRCADEIHSGSAPPSYFSLDDGTEGSGAPDATGNSCFHTLWQIDTAADAIKGDCYDWKNAGSSMHFTWDLQRVGNATGG